jgi:hypothetical protein
MATWFVKLGSVITALTFLVWLGFAAIFPNDRLDLRETIFVWVAIALALLAWRAATLVATRHLTRGRDGR